MGGTTIENNIDNSNEDKNNNTNKKRRIASKEKDVNQPYLDGKILLFIDDSGSTHGCSSYWKQVEILIDDYTAFGNLENFEIFYWSNTLRKKKGEWGGTYPNCIAEHLVKINPSKYLIVIITDGQISSRDLEITKEILIKHSKVSFIEFYFGRLDFHIIGNAVNDSLSVCAPFSMFSTHSTLFSGEKMIQLRTLTSIHKLNELLNDIIDYDDFKENFDMIRDTIMCFSLGMNELKELIPQLRNLKMKLINNIKRNLEIEKFNAEEENDFEIMEKWKIFGVIPLEIEKKFYYLIELCKKRTFNFESFSLNRINTAEDENEINNINEEENDNNNIDNNDNNNNNNNNNEKNDNNKYECPISMEFGTPGILLYNPENIHSIGKFIHSLNQKFCNDIITNPFLLLNNNKINITNNINNKNNNNNINNNMNNNNNINENNNNNNNNNNGNNDKKEVSFDISSLIGHSISLSTFQELKKNQKENEILLCPFTRFFLI